MLTQADISRITNQLTAFDCNPREAAIYAQCLQMGPSSVQEIARKLGYNRVTVHSAVEQLMQKGFLCETRKGKKRLIVAESPSVFSRILQRRANELKEMEGSLEQIVDFFRSVQGPKGSVPTVKFYEEVEGFKRMLEETLKAREEVLVFTYVDLFSKLIGPDYLEDYFVRRAAKGISTRLIFPPCPFSRRVNKKSKQYRIQVRELPEELVWRSGIFSWNDCIALMSFTQSKITCTIVENEDITNFYRKVIFELIWKLAKPM